MQYWEITHITRKEEKRDTYFKLFFCDACGNFYQFVHVKQSIDRERTTITFKAHIIQILFFEEIACYSVLIKRFYVCIFGVNINPYIRLTEPNAKVSCIVDCILIPIKFRQFNRILQFRPVGKIGRLIALQIRLRVFTVALQFKDTVLFKCLDYPCDYLFTELCISHHSR